MAAAVSHAAHPETTTGLDNRKLLMWAFLGSDCLFFGSLVATYLLYHGKSLVGPYPHEVFNIPYTSVSAFVLLMSSLTMVLALAAIQRGDLRGLRIWLLATALLGATFLGGQYFEFTTFVEHGLTIKSNLFGSSFFTLTGFHGLHVTVGVIILLSFWLRAMRNKVTPQQHLNIELAGLYWHFVDVVWIVIFTVVYLVEAPNIVT
ncbi:MAG: cytochrome c oxidase subunit 3 [Chloroflexi bacterium]|nr:cytochrome c oxidase subunit 3 [Chloroflexota bacterium]